MFPSVSPAHLCILSHTGRAEALLIAAYGKGLKVDTDTPLISEASIP